MNKTSSRWILKFSKVLLLVPLLLLLTYPADAQHRPPPNFTPPALPKELQETTQFIHGLNAEDTINSIVFIDEPVENVFRYLEDLTGKTVLQQESLPSPLLNFDSRGELTRAEAVQAIETLLTLNGVSVTSLGEKFIKAVPTASIRFQSPDIIEGSTLVLPPSQRHYSKVYDVKHLNLDEVTQIVNSLQTPGLSVQLVLKKANAIMVTDSLTNLQQIERVLNRVDVPSQMDSQMIFRNLTYISSDELEERLEAMAQGPLKRFLNGETYFESDERTNQIIIMTEPTNVDIIETVINSLDVDAAPLTKTEVFYLKHAKSEEVASLINSLVSGQSSATRRTTSSSRVNTNKSQPSGTNDNANAATASTGSPSSSNDQFSPYITIEPDERSNAIIAFGTASDLRYITDLISKVDVILAQVKIDVIIAEVNIGDKYNRGIDSFGINLDGAEEITVGLNQLVDSSTGNFVGAISDLPIRVGATLENFTLNSVFQTAATDSDVTIISAPTLVTTHNKEASISAGEKRPIITGSSTDTTGSSIKSSVEQQEIGIQLKVTPLIGSNGVVQMEIEQTIETINGSTLIDGNEQPIVGSRSAISYVSVGDGQVIVLGGLQEVEEKITEGRMFLLGQIPFLGDWLFSSKRTEYNHQDLVIFIRPEVIYSTQEANDMALEYIEKNEQKENINLFMEGRLMEKYQEGTDDEEESK